MTNAPASNTNIPMLAELHIANLVLIAEARLELHPGMNAFTGETGAGKSLLLDALGLLFGARGEADLVRPGADAAEVSARFILRDRELVEALRDELGIMFAPPNSDDTTLGSRRPAGDGAGLRGTKPTVPGQELVVARVLPRAGRARAYANGRPLALPALKELGDRLVDLHGQHENQSLLRPATALEILDRFADEGEARAVYRRAWLAARDAAARLADWRREARDRTGREELCRFQLRELEAARLEDLAAATLDDELKFLRSAETVRAAAHGAAERLDGEQPDSAANLIARSLRELHGLGDAGAEAAALATRLDGLLAEARDLARDLSALSEKAQARPERLAELEERRAALRTLERKHGRDLAGLKALLEDLRARLSDLQLCDQRSQQHEAELERAVAALRAAAANLTRRRQTAARDLQRRVAAELPELGLKGAVIKAALAPHAAADAANAPQPAAADAGADEAARRNAGILPAGGAGETPALEAARLLPPSLQPFGAESLQLLFSANPELPLKPLAECASGGELSRVMLALKGVLAQARGADRLPVVVFDEIDSGVGGRTGAVLGRKLAALSARRQVLAVTHLPQLAAYAQRQIKVEKQRGEGPAAIQAAPVEGAARVAELALMLRGEAATERTRAEAAEMLRAAQADAGRDNAGRS